MIDARPTRGAPRHLRLSPRDQVRRRRRRAALVAVAVVVLGVAALLAASALPALGMRGDLQEGRAQLLRGQRLLLAGDVERAAGAFDRAAAAFRRAEGRPGSFLLRVDGLLPYVGRTPGSVLALTRIGRQVSETGEEVAKAVSDLPGGLAALGPRGGRLPLPPLRSLYPTVRRAAAAITGAQREVDALPTSWVLGPVAEATREVRSALDRAGPVVRGAEAMLRLLPRFAGADRPRRYFLAAQNSTELRGTGGLIGDYAILTLRDGRISVSGFHDIGHLPNLPPHRVPAPSADFARLYDQFGGAGFWLNINMTPDTPTAATMIERLYQRVTGQPLDGTILIDLQGLQELMTSTGPVGIPELGVRIPPRGLLSFMAQGRYRDLAPGKVGEQLVAGAVWKAFLEGADPGKALRALVRAAAQGHLVLHAADPELEAAFRAAGVAGEFGPPPGRADFFASILSNAAANKVDYYLRQTLRYEVWLGPDGTATAWATVRLTNTAPRGLAPSYALGPHISVGGRELLPGEDRSFTAIYCAPRCVVTEARKDGRPVSLPYFRERGASLYASFIEVKPRSTGVYRLRMRLWDVWEGDRAAGRYRLRLQAQPSLPTRATVVVHVPPGMAVGEAAPGVRAEGSAATWEGPVGRVRDLEVSFQRGLLGRVWVRILDLFSRPVIRL